MSVQTTEKKGGPTPEEASTPAQLETVQKLAKRQYRGTCSVYIELGSNYAFLNAFGKGDIPTATAELVKAINKRKSDYEAWKASNSPAVSEPTV